ncbi:MAG: class I SAM-dependent methyltransferase [Anaerolineales bacterium]
MLPADDHFINIYRQRAADYHALITAEDADGNLFPALQSITPLSGKRVLDLGSGTGRIPLLLKGLECEIVAADLHHAVLMEQKRGFENRESGLVQADIRSVPVQDNWADIAIAGWTIGHFTGWFADWEAEAGRALAEMQRAAKPGGVLIILETMGTAVKQPAPPSASLAEYYGWLEKEYGFSRQVIATDYDFGTLEKAAELCDFFFGEAVARKIRANNWNRVPEWTGLWTRRKERE